MHSFFARLIPFIFLGIFIVILIAGLILLSQLLIIGACVGFVLFIIAWIRDALFSKKTPKPLVKTPKQGRTIDHDDL